MKKQNSIKDFLEKAEKIKQQKTFDLSSGEDLAIGIMNLISIEEHLFFTSQKTGEKSLVDLLNEVRSMRVKLMQKIVKDPVGEQWCISKHLLAASMRLLEVGTKELKGGNKNEAWEMFKNSYKLYNLFWGINLKIVDIEELKRNDKEINFLNEKGEKKGLSSVFDKLGSIIQKAVDCCRE